MATAAERAWATMRAKSKVRAWRGRSRRNALDSTLTSRLVAAMSLLTTLVFLYS